MNEDKILAFLNDDLKLARFKIEGERRNIVIQSGINPSDLTKILEFIKPLNYYMWYSDILKGIVLSANN